MKKKIQTHLILLSLCLFFNASLDAQIPNYVPTSGLVGWWPFSGNANDISGSGNNGTINGAIPTVDRSGLPDKSYYFSAPNSKISIPYNASLNVQVTKQFSATCWIYIENLPNLDPRVLYLSSLYAKNYDLSIMGKGQGSDSMKINLSNYNSTSFNFTILSNVKLTRSKWYHIAFTIDALNNSTILYVDGNLVGSTNQVPVIPTSSTITSQIFTIGNHDAANWGFDGKIDDVGVWNRILTAQEINALHNAGVGLNNQNYVNTFKISNIQNSKIINVDIVNLNSLEGYKLKVVNLLGQEVLNINIQNQHSRIDISTLNSEGLYIAYLIDRNGKVLNTKKLHL